MEGQNSYVEITQKVFEEYGEKKAMHYKEIAAHAVAEGWLFGDAAVHAEALLDAVRNDIARNGRASQFASHGQEYLGLRKWMWHGFAAQIHDHNTIVRGMIRKKLLAMNGAQFASCIRKLVEAMGLENISEEISEEIVTFRGTFVAEGVIRIPMTIWALNGEVRINVRTLAEKLSANEYAIFITTAEKIESLSPINPQISVIGPEKLISMLIDKEIWDV